jgi:hypothetical protein
LEKEFQKCLSLEQQYDEKHLLNMIRCFEKTYGRYCDDTAEYWKEKDKQIQKEIEFNLERAKKEKANLYPDNPYKIQANNFQLDNLPKLPDKDTTEPVLKYKSLTETNFRTGYNYEDNESGKEKEKEKDTDGIEGVGDLNIVNNDSESIIDKIIY